MNKQLTGGLALALATSLALAAPAAAPDGSGSMVGTLIGGALFALVLIGAGLLVHRTLKHKDTPATPAAVATPATPANAAKAPSLAAERGELILRDAKASFIRMQAAWDRADTADLSKFTTPQVFAELKAQVDQRGASNDVTEVVSIDAVLLSSETVDGQFLASVKFTGMIKPSAAAPAEPFAEVWNMTRPANGSTGWMLAGIQQLS
jgi:predicted lipid-binding transport protein (Tim44 family)